MAAVTVSPVIAKARKQWTRAAEAEDAQRKAILLAKEFRALKQWPDAIRLAREGAGNMVGQPPQPPRPCLVVDRLSQPVRQISNSIKNADFGFDVMPNGDGADQETADILKGYLRRVENQSRGESPVEWAADQAIEGGIGWFRIRTKHVHETWTGSPDDPEAYDQELVLERITNNLAVYDDPAANKPTRSDSLFRFIVEDMDWDAYKARFPKAQLSGLEEFQSTGDMSAWVSKDVIRVAEWWRVEHKDREIWASKDLKQHGEGKPPDGVEVMYHRTIREPIVKGSLINAVEELESFDWVGSRMPQVPVLGEELNVDGKPILRGIIAMGMDAQRMVNYTYSGAVEIFALGGKSPYIAAAESIAQYKSVWDTANTYNYSYLPFDEYVEGRQYRKPERDQSEAPIQAAVALMRTSEEALKASTSTGDASLGNSNPNERSGKALQALQVQSELANSNYPDNVRRALIYAAELMIEVIPKITRPGQIIHILGMDDEPDQVMVGQPFIKGPDGIPQPAPEHITPEMARLQDNLYKFYDPTRGRYATTVTIGKASATRREEGSKALGELIPHLPPEMAAVVMPDYVKQLSFPGAQGIAERLESVLPEHLRSKKKDGAQAVPPEVQAQMQQMQAALQEAQQAIATDQAKQQASIESVKIKEQGEMTRAELDAQVKIEIARMDNATKLQIEEFKMRGTAMQAELDAREAQLGASQKDADRAAKMADAEAGREHESAEAREAREAAERQAADGREHEATMAEQARQAAAAQAQAGA